MKMKRSWRPLLSGIWLLTLLIMKLPRPVFALDTTFSGNFTNSNVQADDETEHYEVKASKKLLRGAENISLCYLEISQGVKTEKRALDAEYLPFGVDSFFTGFFKGLGNGVKRAAVGAYEVATFTYAQGPILPEYSEWLY